MAGTGICTAIENELNTNTTGRVGRYNMLYGDIGTATATHPDTISGAATVSKPFGIVTTDTDVNSAAAAVYTLTLTNSQIAATSLVMVEVQNGTCTTGTPVVTGVTPGSGTCTIVVTNKHASAAFNGSLVIKFMVIKSIAELA